MRSQALLRLTADGGSSARLKRGTGSPRKLVVPPPRAVYPGFVMGLALAASSQRQTTPVASINTTPLVDVMLVLLIIFMIAAPLFTHKVRFTVPVPTEDKAETTPPEQTLTIEPGGVGVRYRMDGEALSGSALPAALRRVASAKEQTRLNLVVDPGVAYAEVAAVLALARQSGVKKMGFDDLKGVTKH